MPLLFLVVLDGSGLGWLGGQTPLHRGGGSQELIIILQGTKVGGDYGLDSQIDYSPPLHSE